jgi:hypothetical protein
VRPTGIVEHEVVFMCTNTASNRLSYQYDGTNFLKVLKAEHPDYDLMYAGADAYASSLGVFTGHGESVSCWTNTMRQTPGKVNLMADGTQQHIDRNYFEPPSGTNLWIYASIDDGSVNSLSMVIGDVTNTSAVIIVPQVNGTFSTSIVYVVKKWFEMDAVFTNEVGKSAAEVAGARGAKGVWTLDLSGLKISDPENRKFFGGNDTMEGLTQFFSDNYEGKLTLVPLEKKTLHQYQSDPRTTQSGKEILTIMLEHLNFFQQP